MKEYNGLNVTLLNVDQISNLCKEITTEGLYSGIIYCYTNFTNSKRYIGQTRNPKERHSSHIRNEYRLQDRTPLHLAIIKYGKESFKYEVLELCIADNLDSLRNELNQLEQHYISVYNSRVRSNGYNVAIGGQFNQEKAPENGQRPVDMYDLNGTLLRSFQSIAEAQRFTGMIGTGIRDVCNHLSRTSAGYVWAWKGDPVEILPNSNEVHQYDLDGYYITSYNSASDACKRLGLKSPGSLSGPLRDKYRIGAKSYWRRYKADRIPITDFPKAIFSYNLDGSFCKAYIRLQDAIEDVEASGASAICSAINLNKSYRGRIWKREYLDSVEPCLGRDANNIVVKAITMDGKETIYGSIKAAAIDNGVTIGRIRTSIKSGATINGVVYERCGVLSEVRPDTDNLCNVQDIANKELSRPGRITTAVDQYNLEYKPLKTYSTIAQAERENNLNNITAAIRKAQLCGNYIWVKHGDDIPASLIEYLDSLKVYAYNKEGHFVAEYATKEEAALAIGYASSNSHIGRCIREPWRKAKGFYWRNYKCEKISVENLKP